MQAPRLVLPHGVLPTRGVSRAQIAFLAVAALAASLMVVSPPLPSVPAASGGAAESRAVDGYGKLPISFEPNVGQAPNRYDFVARGQGFGMAINATGASLALGTKEAQDLVRLNLLGADRSATPRSLESLPGVVNYFIGNDPAKWRSEVPTFGRVSYNDVLPGIDVTYYGTNAGTLEYDFVVAPGADPTDIRVKFSGASDVALRDGSLVITTASGAVTQEAPVLYQSIAGRRVPVEGRFSIEGHEVGFEVGAYDHNHPLVIDPTLAYSTYLGGTGDDSAQGIAVDGSGAAYVTGSADSTTFPTPPFPGSNANAGQTDAFVTKLDPSGQTLIYSTYLGGSGIDIGYEIAVDGTGAAYVAGATDSTNLPTTVPPVQGSNAGGTNDAFVTKLDPSGQTLIYSTYLGGTGDDFAEGIAVDASGAAYVTGSTDSTTFPTPAFPGSNANAGQTDAFVTKLHPSGQTLIYSTFLGGSGFDLAHGIAVDGTGAAYVTGATASTDFPTSQPPAPPPFSGSNAGVSSHDAFVTKLAPSGQTNIYSTYLGGTDGDYAQGIAVDGSGEAYVTGYTASTNFPTTHPPFPGSNLVPDDAFVTKLNATGSALAYSTYLGGSNLDYGWGIAVDGSGAAYVTGWTFSTDFSTTQPSLQGSNAGASDAFVTKLNASGQTLDYSTYLGGSNDDLGYGIAVDGSGAAYVAGYTNSGNYPTTQPPVQGTFAGLSDAFVTKLGGTPPVTCGGQAVTIQVTIANQTTFGTVGADVINGTSGIDTIDGLGGNDIICGLGGNDRLHGGKHNDKVFGDAGNDTITGDVGNDKLNGGNGTDNLNGNDGVDTLNGGDGNDTINGSAGSDTLNGNNGADRLHGGDGSDTLNGNANNDNLFGGLGADTLSGGLGNDTLNGAAGNDYLYGQDGTDSLYGTAGKDTLYGIAGNDFLSGGAGSDYLSGGNGSDTLNGNADNDKLYGNDGNDSLNGGPGTNYCDGGAPPVGDTGTLCQTSINIP